MPIEKKCPRCGVAHRKRGPYCSRSCGNVREHTEEDKEIRRKKLKDYQLTPEGVATRYKSAEIMAARNRGEEIIVTSMDDYAVNIPNIPDPSILDDMFEGFEKGENW